MSSEVVRVAFETEWPTAMGIPLYGTLNEEPDRSLLPSQWASVEYLPVADIRISLGEQACWRESGTIQVSVFVDAGVGDTSSTIIADSVRNAYRDWRDDEVTVMQSDPPQDEGQSDGRWYVATVNLLYRYQRVI